MRTVVSLCDGTGAWSQPYVDAGYNVVRVTLPDCDVRDYAERIRLLGRVRARVHNVVGVLAAPPCTEFAVSGARWWAGKDPALLTEAVAVVRACLDVVQMVGPKWWALENPVGRIVKCVPELGEPAFAFNPCDYGDPYTKKTLLWGRFQMPLPTPVLATEGSKMHLVPPGPRRAQIRSVTPAGFAHAFFEANR